MDINPNKRSYISTRPPPYEGGDRGGQNGRIRSYLLYSNDLIYERPNVSRILGMNDLLGASLTECVWVKGKCFIA